MIPGMQRSTKQFCWVYHLQKSQLKRTLLCLGLATFFQCKSETAFWIKTISVANRVKHCHSVVNLSVSTAVWIFWRESITFKGGKIYKYGCNCEQVLVMYLSTQISQLYTRLLFDDNFIHLIGNFHFQKNTF